MSTLAQFLDPANVSLKICGVTLPDDAHQLIEHKVDALGVNFWPQSKRHLPWENAGWLRQLKGRILRVGVFVNQPVLPAELYGQDLIDVVQLHGDESPEEAAIYRNNGIPFIKAIGVNTIADLERAADFGASAILLDAPAPGTYGGTGHTFDWTQAIRFKQQHPDIPVILAGGIGPGNAVMAVHTVRPAALDVASGAEFEPGIKDIDKVTAIQAAL
ncbi:MAG: phosphoribosylanthranilate isomerase [Verrucomicrobiales bacterium]|nr:phosphoribosylanthranilate isomerase [Verrucomicrobiota bacterium JB025]